MLFVKFYRNAEDESPVCFAASAKDAHAILAGLALDHHIAGCAFEADGIMYDCHETGRDWVDSLSAMMRRA